MLLQHWGWWALRLCDVCEWRSTRLALETGVCVADKRFDRQVIDWMRSQDHKPPETGAMDGVLDGDVDQFIKRWKVMVAL